MKRDDSVYLHHILDAIRRVQEYTQSMSLVEFLEEYMVQDAVIRQLEVIGEAARNISHEFKDLHPEIPWQKMIGIRNKIIHAYFEVNNQIVWDTVVNDLPMLEQQVVHLVKE